MKKDLKIIVYIYGYLEFNKVIQTKEHFMTDKYGLQIWKRKEKLKKKNWLYCKTTVEAL